MATHSSVLAWRIPGTVGPGGLLSMGLHRVGHDWSDLAAEYIMWNVGLDEAQAGIKIAGRNINNHNKLNIKKTDWHQVPSPLGRQMWKQWKQWVIFLGSKITADNDYSHEIKRHLLLGRKAMINLNGMLKSRDIILPIKVSIIKAMFCFVLFCFFQ